MAQFKWMHRIKLTLIAIALIISGQIISGQATVQAGYFEGKQAYKSSQYAKAATEFKQVTPKSSKYSLAQFYLGLIYGKQDKYQQAKDHFQQVINVEQTRKLRSGGAEYNANLLKKAEKNLAVITKSELEARGDTEKAQALSQYYGSSKGNYLTQAMSHGSKVIRWDLKKMPLKVFIASGSTVRGWNTNKNQAVYNALRTWKAATNNQLRFQIVHNITDADIVVRWQQYFTHNKLGVSPLKMMGNTILQSDVHLAMYDRASGKLLSNEQLNWVALHEFGHALGIRGHSPHTDDAMFFATNYSQTGGLTARDRNTIKLLYRQTADVSNNTQVSTAKTKQVYDLIKKAQPYIGKNDAKAWQYINQAYKIDPTNKDVITLRNGIKYNKGVNYINNGVAYAKSHRLTDARSSFRSAEKIFLALMQEPNPPSGTRQNLQTARKNLSVLEN